MSISVVTLGTSTWPLVDRLERLHGDVTVVRRCLDLAELLACAHTRMAHVALVAEGAEELTASLLDQLETDDLRVLVVEGHDESRVQRLGVGSVPPDATGEELARIITRAMLGRAKEQPGEPRAEQSQSPHPPRTAPMGKVTSAPTPPDSARGLPYPVGHPAIPRRRTTSMTQTPSTMPKPAG